MKKIVVINHKSGVAKTTTCFHLGWGLSEKGKRVLLVDADPQCNLTMYALGKEGYESFYKENPKDSIYHALIPAFKSKITPIQAVNCRKIRDNLYLLPGHLDFTENQTQLGVSIQLYNAFSSMENLPGSINYLVEQTAEKYAIDYVIFDVNSSLSAINQVIFACCDYFMIPTSPDLFSLMSIESLSRFLPAWGRWGKKARGVFREAVYPVPDSHPAFLGYTVNDYPLSEDRPPCVFQEFMVKISEAVQKEIIPAFQKEKMTLDQEQYETALQLMKAEMPPHSIDYPDVYCLAWFSDCHKLIALSEDQSLPVYRVEVDDAADGQERTRQWFSELYPAFVNRVLRLMSDEP